ncbi:MAG: hypothetical protein R3B09_09645 [Nannocystaceae bacterium]
MRSPPLLSVVVGLALAGCSGLPRDPAGTSDRVAERGVIRLGDVEGAAPEPAAERALSRLAAATGARIERVPGHGEELLEGLQEGEYDLVYGRFADDSPWAEAVHLGRPLGDPVGASSSQRAPRFAFRHGENGWIAAVEEAAR